MGYSSRTEIAIVQERPPRDAGLHDQGDDRAEDRALSSFSPADGPEMTKVPIRENTFSKVSAEASSTVVLFPVLLASSKSNPRLEACFEFWTLCFSLATKAGSSFKV